MRGLEAVLAARVIPVLRGDSPERVIEVATVLLEEGFTALEVTFTVPGAAGVIETLAGRHPAALVGAGTVLNGAQADEANRAGAAFLVSPGYSGSVAEFVGEADIPYLPGVVTPTEVMAALERGFTALKLFPGDLGGPAYLRALRGPFPNARFMPTGGVSAENLADWAAAGAVAVGMGSSLTRGEPEAVRREARRLRTAMEAIGWA